MDPACRTVNHPRFKKKNMSDGDLLKLSHQLYIYIYQLVGLVGANAACNVCLKFMSV